MGRKRRGNGQLQLNARLLGPSVGFILPGLDGSGRRRGPSTRSIEQPQTRRETRSPDGPKPGVRGGAGRQRVDSWERRGAAFVAAPPLSKYSKLFTPRRPFLPSSTLFMSSHFIQGQERGDRRRATEQTVEKGGCHLYPVPRRTGLLIFLFELQAVELSPEFDVRKLN